MKYMLLLHSNPADEPSPTSPEFAESMQRWFTYTNALTQAGAHISGDALRGVEPATTVRMRDGERGVTDGPFVESKQALGGYYVIDVGDLDAALDWAARIPHVSIGTVEVRPVLALSEA